MFASKLSNWVMESLEWNLQKCARNYNVYIGSYWNVMFLKLMEFLDKVLSWPFLTLVVAELILAQVLLLLY